MSWVENRDPSEVKGYWARCVAMKSGVRVVLHLLLVLASECIMSAKRILDMSRG